MWRHLFALFIAAPSSLHCPTTTVYDSPFQTLRYGAP